MTIKDTLHVHFNMVESCSFASQGQTIYATREKATCVALAGPQIATTQHLAVQEVAVGRNSSGVCVYKVPCAGVAWFLQYINFAN